MGRGPSFQIRKKIFDSWSIKSHYATRRHITDSIKDRPNILGATKPPKTKTKLTPQHQKRTFENGSDKLQQAQDVTTLWRITVFRFHHQDLDSPRKRRLLKFSNPLSSVSLPGAHGCQEHVKPQKTYLLIFLSHPFYLESNFKLIRVKNFKFYINLKYKTWLLAASELKIIFCMKFLKFNSKSYRSKKIFEAMETFLKRNGTASYIHISLCIDSIPHTLK